MRFSWRKGDRVENGAPTIHETAIQRARKGAHRYAPIGIPQKYTVLSDAGLAPQSSVESENQAKTRCAKQEEIWNYVWRRRIIYFTTVFASLYLAIYPLSQVIRPSGEFDNGLSIISSGIRTVGQVLPGALSLWIDAYARDPSHFLVLGALVVILIWLGVWLGGKIRDRMERVWRSVEVRPQSKLEVVFGVVGASLLIYAAIHNYLPQELQLPRGGERFLANHVSGSVKTIAIATLIALFTPAPVVFHLRSWRGYRAAVRGLRLFLLPLFFAVSFIVAGLLFTSHIAFSVEEANGMACKQSDVITKAIEVDPLGEKGTTVENKGLQACLSAGIASCSTRGAAPTCSNGREVFCGEGQAVCEQKHKAGCDDGKANCLYDVPVCRVQAVAEPGKPATNHVTGLAVCPSICETEPIGKAKQFAINEVCHATGVWLEEGQKYEITMLPPSPSDENYKTVAWRDDDGSIVSTRGKITTGILAKIRESLLWPLKRHLFDERFKVIARVGSVGSDERVLEPNDDPKSNTLNVQITPKRGGELFLYVNEAVWGWPSFYGYFYDGVSCEAFRLFRISALAG